MMMKRRCSGWRCIRRGALGLGLLGSAGLAGCVANLDAVRTFAKTSAATADYRQVVADYVDSPERQKAYQPERQYPALDRLTAERRRQRAALESAQKILADYLNVLGDVAADDLPNMGPNIDGLRTALADAGLAGAGAPIGPAAADAAGALAKVVLRAAADHWRQRQVRRLVTEADPHVQAVVAGLRDLVNTDFRASLRNDSLAVELFFDDVGAYGRNSPGLVRLARLVARDHRAAVQRRLAQQRAYGQVLATIGRGHHALAQHIGQLKGPQVKALLAGYARDLQELYKSFTELRP